MIPFPKAVRGINEEEEDFESVLKGKKMPSKSLGIEEESEGENGGLGVWYLWGPHLRDISLGLMDFRSKWILSPTRVQINHDFS